MSDYTMRAPCPKCGTTTGTLKTVNGQDTVRCAWCKHPCYNAPKTETGREQRTLRTRPNLKVSQRTRILLRDNGTCVLCHRADVPLDVGHLISVNEGHANGIAEADLFDDENLAAMCASCNSGLSDETVPVRLLVAALKVRLKNRENGFAATESQIHQGDTSR